MIIIEDDVSSVEVCALVFSFSVTILDEKCEEYTREPHWFGGSFVGLWTRAESSYEVI